MIYHARSTLGGRLQAKVRVARAPWAGRAFHDSPRSTGRGLCRGPRVPPTLRHCHLLGGLGTRGAACGRGCCPTVPGPSAPGAARSTRRPERVRPEAWRPRGSGVPCVLCAGGVHEDVPGPVPHGLCAPERHLREVRQVRWCHVGGGGGVLAPPERGWAQAGLCRHGTVWDVGLLRLRAVRWQGPLRLWLHILSELLSSGGSQRSTCLGKGLGHAQGSAQWALRGGGFDLFPGGRSPLGGPRLPSRDRVGSVGPGSSLVCVGSWVLVSDFPDLARPWRVRDQPSRCSRLPDAGRGRPSCWPGRRGRVCSHGGRGGGQCLATHRLAADCSSVCSVCLSFFFLLVKELSWLLPNSRHGDTHQCHHGRARWGAGTHQPHPAG